MLFGFVFVFFLLLLWLFCLCVLVRFFGGEGRKGGGTGTRIISVLHIFSQIDPSGCGSTVFPCLMCLKSCRNLSYDKFKSHLKLSCLHPLKWSQSLVLLLVLVDFDLIVSYKLFSKANRVLDTSKHISRPQFILELFSECTAVLHFLSPFCDPGLVPKDESES